MTLLVLGLGGLVGFLVWSLTTPFARPMWHRLQQSADATRMGAVPSVPVDQLQTAVAPPHGNRQISETSLSINSARGRHVAAPSQGRELAGRGIAAGVVGVFISGVLLLLVRWALGWRVAQTTGECGLGETPEWLANNTLVRQSPSAGKRETSGTFSGTRLANRPSCVNCGLARPSD